MRQDLPVSTRLGIAVVVFTIIMPFASAAGPPEFEIQLPNGSVVHFPPCLPTDPNCKILPCQPKIPEWIFEPHWFLDECVPHTDP